MKKFNGKYRIESARLQSWDYGSHAAYFVTIYTADRAHYFGHIRNGIMCLNHLGAIAHQQWIHSALIRPDMNLELDAFVVMPNHMHGIIIIGDNRYNRHESRTDAMHDESRTDAMHDESRTDAMHCVSSANKFGPQHKNLASIIRGYKSAVTTWARKNNVDFGWQPRFHDHIIHNELSWRRIRNYIENNPVNWTKDTFNG